MVAPTRRPMNPYAGPRVGAGAGSGARPVSASQIYRRPTMVTILAVLNIIGAVFILLVVAGLTFMVMTQPEMPSPGLIQVVAVVYAALGLIGLACGIGLWNLKGYGRTLQIVSSVIGLVGFPIGTLISVLILVYMFKPGAKVLFSETPVSRLSASDIEEVRKLHQSSGALVAVVAVVVLLAVVAFIGIIAAIAIPSLLRARVSANEAAAIGDIRSVISAEAAYSSANGGHFDRPGCLVRPQGCIPGYPDAAPVFLGQEDPPTKLGYQREFVPGPATDNNYVALGNISPSSVESFAYIAYPASPGVTGVRSFCGDYSGRMCVYPDGSRPPADNGQCALDCTPLQ
jgi:type IV pilus assembly protein PilA